MMRILVSGSRYWDDYKTLRVVLAGFNALYENLTIIEGGAPGADQLSQLFVQAHARPGLNLMTFLAKWRVHDREGLTPVKCWCPPGQKLCKPAGHRRNQLMIDEGNPAVLVSFKDGLDPKLKSGGSEDMIRRAETAGIHIIHIDHGGTAWPLAS
jgi:hypothetical protein